MNHILLSVCICVYNGERFLRRCLDSVVFQNMPSMEIVLVNDGSTDSSAWIMQEYKERFPKIRVIEHANRGLAQSRLTGVENSSGEYITFLDADDYLLEGAYETVLLYMENNKADIYEFQTIREGYYSRSPYSGTMDARQVLIDYFNGIKMPVNYWLRWYKRELLTESVFPIGKTLYEDVYAFPCILSNAGTIVYIGKPLHVHTKNPASIMNQLYANRNSREYMERQKTILGAIPHIRNSIGLEMINTVYKVPFAHYTAETYRDFVFMEYNGISYNEKLDAVISTFETKVPKKELEAFISRNITLNSKLNIAIRFLGLHNAYRIYRLIR